MVHIWTLQPNIIATASAIAQHLCVANTDMAACGKYYATLHLTSKFFVSNIQTQMLLLLLSPLLPAHVIGLSVHRLQKLLLLIIGGDLSIVILCEIRMSKLLLLFLLL